MTWPNLLDPGKPAVLDAAAKAAFEKHPEAVALPNYDGIEVPGMR